MYLNHIYPLRSPSTFPQDPMPYLPPNLLSSSVSWNTTIDFNPLSSISEPTWAWGWIVHWNTDNLPGPIQAPLLAWDLRGHSTLHNRILYWTVLVRILPKQALLPWAYMCVQQPCYVQRTTFHSIPTDPSAFTFFSPLFPDISFRAYFEQGLSQATTRLLPKMRPYVPESLLSSSHWVLACNFFQCLSHLGMICACRVSQYKEAFDHLYINNQRLRK